MSWFDSLRAALDGSPSALSQEHQLRLEAWSALPGVDLAIGHPMTRYVIVKAQASGHEADAGRLISIGAIALNGGLIDPLDAFEVVLRQDAASSDANILEHGIGAGAQRDGVPAPEALLRFLEFAGKWPLVAYHAGFCQGLVERAASTALDMRPELPWIDLARILPELFRVQQDTMCGLDVWLEILKIPSLARSHTMSDCYATAQLAQMALRRAAAIGKETPADLIRLEESRRWLRHS